MTQKEINKFLANTKVYVNGKSKEIQEKLFSLGYKWGDGHTDVNYTEEPFLFIYRDMYFTRDSNMVCFCNHENREISAEEILSLELKESAYRPFKDKDECWNEMLKHEPFGWLKSKQWGSYSSIGTVGKGNGKSLIIRSTDECHKDSMDYIYENYTFADGTPFGIKED